MCTGTLVKSSDGYYYQSRTLEYETVIKFIPFISNNIIGSVLPSNNAFCDGLNKMHYVACHFISNVALVIIKK